MTRNGHIRPDESSGSLFDPTLLQLGSPLPPGDQHAVSVYLPTWKDTVGWATRDPKVLCRMQVGYPRFFVPLVVEQLSRRLMDWAVGATMSSAKDDATMVLLAAPGRLALLVAGEAYATSCQTYLQSHGNGDVAVLRITLDGKVCIKGDDGWPTLTRSGPHDAIFAVVYPPQLAKEAKAFWQHTGFGISSRCASFWMENCAVEVGSQGTREQLPVEEAAKASEVLRGRIGGLFSSEVDGESVFLYPTGMAAISHSAAAMTELRGADSGAFLYVDTLKVLGKVHGFDCVLYGHANLDRLEADLDQGQSIDALYTEFPGNPLLGCVDLDRLHVLSVKHDFFLIVDDTVATSVNVELLHVCDMACTSLTKMFSGGCNVMGGSVTVNPNSPRRDALCAALAASCQANLAYFPRDVVVMEANSRDFAARVAVASRNAQAVVRMLRSDSAVTHVFYPEGNADRAVYDRFRRPGRGYGYLLSMRFPTAAAAVAFHDGLAVAKGPSLGTDFTLCCAYTLFAHYGELEWAAEHGVVEHLVRISVGVESERYLLDVVRRALKAAGEAIVVSSSHAVG